jgi:hypothetical protein
MFFLFVFFRVFLHFNSRFLFYLGSHFHASHPKHPTPPSLLAIASRGWGFLHISIYGTCPKAAGGFVIAQTLSPLPIAITIAIANPQPISIANSSAHLYPQLSLTPMARRSTRITRKRGESDPNQPPKKQKTRHVDNDKESSDKESSKKNRKRGGKNTKPTKKGSRYAICSFPVAFFYFFFLLLFLSLTYFFPRSFHSFSLSLFSLLILGKALKLQKDFQGKYPHSTNISFLTNS